MIESAFNFETTDKITLGSVRGLLEEVNKQGSGRVSGAAGEERSMSPRPAENSEECVSIESVREMLKTDSIYIEELLEDYERKIISEALRQNRKLKTAAEKLGISPQKLNYRLHKLNLKDFL
ncbi:MAG: helix-turn-helix domain-containing protein [Anaerovoracaceae bacterium]|nr:hypothetical protein [Bacillota bacterium]MEE0516982.1 helix-turn-helix domain-containing protein [Anaerovoracaceae bacterium]